MTGRKGYSTVLNCRWGLDLYGECGGFSSNFCNSGEVKITWHYGTTET